MGRRGPFFGCEKTEDSKIRILTEFRYRGGENAKNSLR